jgi:cation diffusion facilitator CzcD-associated flavoprotein CzcO
MEANNHFDAIVLGAGLAGLTAGIYLSRAKRETWNQHSLLSMVLKTCKVLI